jgi:predicted nucleic acid-binding protein
MIVVDANLLVYPRVASMPQHASAHAWLGGILNRANPAGLPWSVLLALERLTLNPRVFERPPTLVAAWAQVREWLACEPAWMPEPTVHHAQVLDALMPNVVRP